MGQTKNVFRLLLLTFGMFGFGFALDPLYDIFCDITGLNGKVSGPTFVSYDEELQTRSMKVTFVTLNNKNMPWSFKADSPQMQIETGKDYLMNFTFTNTTLEPMVAQAIPSVSPGRGAKYFHKTECFCFNQQPLAAGETAELGLSFIVDIDIPKHINTITLSYTLFDITQQHKTGNKTSSLLNGDLQQLAGR